MGIDDDPESVAPGAGRPGELGGTPTKATVGYLNVREIINAREARTVIILTTVPGPKRPSQPLSVSQFHRCLRNPYYKGVVTYRGVSYPGTHQPLVSAGVWERVQRNLDAQNTAGERKRSHPHYLKGTVHCGRCESRLIITEAKNRYDTIYRYFIASGASRNEPPANRAPCASNT